MPQIRLMGSDAAAVQETAEAMLRALRASTELRVGDVSTVPNRRGPGVRVYVELLLREPTEGQPVTVTVEREDRPGSGRAARVRGSREALPPSAPRW
ncbi:hypothetical protein ACFQ0M_48700 [Kitasatospora aburaviensis]|uniref:Uncharacterized protein n=1 Tax=Kitasatospora aburaviensis TaxID=67265 RepID=A0ABW1F664_9ACTN